MPDGPAVWDVGVLLAAGLGPDGRPSRVPHSLSQTVSCGNPPPPNNSPGGGDDPASGRLGKGLGQGGRESWSPSGGFRRKRAPALLFPFGDPSRLLWARVTHRPNGKTISTGECFFHIPQYREQHCDRWHFSTLMPEPRRAPSLL